MKRVTDAAILGYVLGGSFVVAILMLLAVAAQADDALICGTDGPCRVLRGPQELVGEWCHTGGVVNGWDNLNKEYIPRTDTYERGIADCDEDKRITLDRDSLRDVLRRGLSYTLEGNTLTVEGGWLKPATPPLQKPRR